MRQIKVLVVEDSMVFRQLLVQNLNKDPEIRVIAAVSNPYEARDAIIEYRPDVMTLDVELPRMNGIDFLRKLLPQYPIPVVVISALSDKVFDAMDAGAVEFVGKPEHSTQESISRFVQKELPDKIKIASVANVDNLINQKKNKIIRDVTVGKDIKLIAIGASTGGTEATASVIKSLKADLPGIIIVQHMPAGFTEMYAKRLDGLGELSVKEAKDGDTIKRGHVLVAPGGDKHMSVIKDGKDYRVVLRKSPKVNGHCPSVDVMFDSVASVYGQNALGIILTGMGGDGAKGLLRMRQLGARTIGQSEETCVVYGMPKVAYDIGAVEYQERLENIPRKTYQILGK